MGRIEILLFRGDWGFFGRFRYWDLIREKFLSKGVRMIRNVIKGCFIDGEEVVRFRLGSRCWKWERNIVGFRD